MEDHLIRSQLYLAALLHDIGKFYQRADENPASRSVLLKEWVKNNETILCPKHYRGNYYTHKHVLWTAQFFEDHKETFKKILGSEKNADELLIWAAKHHLIDSNNIYQQIIQKADHLASGVDRTKQEGQKDAEAEAEGEKKWDDFKRVQMHSIFEGLFRDPFECKYSTPVTFLQLNESFFPEEQPVNHDYKNLWDHFIKEFISLPSVNSRAFSENLFNLLRKYTVTIPSSTQHLPDVSLFDHSKMVAAFAVCLHDYLLAKNKLSAFELKSDEEVVLLVGGDISGIQAYIYNIVSKQAAKNLKGRSFYLQLLVDSVIESIVKELNLFKANVVYASGGGFYLLVPNTEENREKLQKIEQELSDQLFAEHKVSLFLALDFVTLSEDDILGKLKPEYGGKREPNRISEKWKNLIEKLNARKRSRYAGKLVDQYAYFFEEAEKGAQLEKDYITGEEIANHEKAHPIKENDEIIGYIKKNTQQQIELRRYLRQTNYIIKSQNKIIHWEPEKDFLHYANPCGLNVHWYFTCDAPESSADGIEIYVLNKTEFINNNFKGNNLIHDFVFYGGNQYPVNENGEPRYFDHLAGHKDDTFKRLGVLRMDVDNLGQAFIKGFRDERKTFSRYTALSRSLDFFFKGYINTIWENNQEFKEWINIVYAGGDDLFVVGKWDVVIDFAENIYTEFRKWTCYNPHLTLSAGIAIVPEKFPILKAAEMAGDAEHKAKEHQCGAEEKNAICFLDMPLNWEKEFPTVKSIKEELVKRINSEQLPSGFLHKINTLFEMRKRQIEKNENQSWQWIMAYDFARMKQRKKDNSDLNMFIDNLQKDIICNTHNGNKMISKYGFLELLNLAARWAELELRTLKNKNYETPAITL